MELSEAQMNFGAILFELGLPVVAITIALRWPACRTFVVAILGAVTPALVFYAAATIAYCLNPADKGHIIAFYAMWLMSFFAYVVLFLGGLIAAFIPKPSNPYLRFLTGLACGAAFFALVNGVWKFFLP